MPLNGMSILQNAFLYFVVAVMCFVLSRLLYLAFQLI